MATPPETVADERVPALPGPLTDAYGRRWRSVVDRWASRPGTTLATLGPAGTSSHLTAAFLAERHGLRIELSDSFDAVLAALVERRVDQALVPSAYQGLTRFHWHRDLRLDAYFAQATPEYGIAARPDRELDPAGGQLTVAALWEVRRIFTDLAPPALRDRPVRWVDADSTQHAAEILAADGADLAVTNAPGVHRHALRWVALRPGAEIVWTLFGRR
ncbi:prephenate dehydratase [Micromonospora sp. WMMD961]|uniref:prephenate dehydratase n=1 Tax=Micromonospora sp. WMMD961 TaxID=3016100 RepID=UPI002417FE54|nr:prephenate dehydratase [Micromonospora sp. WMMD961]MDG4780855.1 prephenate dehydratase [Micromonospora sp. WMMD961]